MDQYFQNYREKVNFKPDKLYKTTLFQSERLLLGMNCLEPGQIQKVHEHADQDKFYFVLEGEGLFTVGEETKSVVAGTLVLTPAGVPHGVENEGPERLVIFMGIAPSP